MNTYQDKYQLTLKSDGEEITIEVNREPIDMFLGIGWGPAEPTDREGLIYQQSPTQTEYVEVQTDLPIAVSLFEENTVILRVLKPGDS